MPADLPRRRLLLGALAALAGGVPSGAAAIAAVAAAGDLRSAPLPTPLLATAWSAAAGDPADYLVSEKLDGVRGLWDGTRLRFRSGRPVAAPAGFTAGWPRLALDGELWLGRGRFDELSGRVRKARPLDADWRDVRFRVFELPGGGERFADRVVRLGALAAGNRADATWSVIEQSRVADAAALQRRLTETVAAGGEGLMLHLASAPVVGGRSDLLRKLKPVPDAEAIVVGHRRGHGKYAGQLGALELETPEGRRFFVGSGLGDALRRAPPPLGRVVTYRYRALTPAGAPRFASFWRLHDAL